MLLTLQSRQLSREVGKVSASALKTLLSLLNLSLTPQWMRRKIPSPMLKYLYRTCPKCGDYLGVIVRDPPEPMKEVPIDAYVVCGFKLGWKVVLGNKGLTNEQGRGPG